MKKMMKVATMVLAMVIAVTAMVPTTVQAATKKVSKSDKAIYIASFDSSKKNHVESVKFNKKGQLIVKANFNRGDEDKNGFMAWKSTGMKTFVFNELPAGVTAATVGIDGGTDYHLHNYKNGKKNPKFYHYTEEEFIKSVEKRYDTSWKLVITMNGNGGMVSAAIVKYSGEWTDRQRNGYKEPDAWHPWNELECAWAVMHYTKDGTPVGYGPEAVELMKKWTYDGELIR